MDLLRRFTEYLYSSHNNLSKRTVKNYRADLNSFLNWYKKEYNLDLGLAPSLVTSQIVESYKKSKIQDSNLSSSSLNRHFSSLRKFFKFLKNEGIILEDPFEQMKILQKNALPKDNWRLLAFRNYLQLHNKSILTIKNYIIDLKHFLNWTEQVTKENVLSEINPGIVNEYKKRLLEHQFSPRTINRNLSSIRQYLRWRATEGLMRSSEFRVQSSELGSELNETIESPPIFNPEKPLTRYSPFPPLRLIQKTGRTIDLVFDIIFIAPLIKITDALSSTIWKIKGKPVFTKIKEDKFSEAAPMPPLISTIPKEFYAPLSISTRYFPWHKKAWHYMRHRRPNWYKKYHSHSIAHYFHLAILVLFASQLGFVIYQNITQSSQNQKSVLGTLQTNLSSILTFKGKLADNSNNAIIVSDSPVRMSIYNHETATGSSLLWQEVVDINTDSEGRFSVVLGSNTYLPQNLFWENEALWLGVSVGEEAELTPREPLANVALANSAQKLQGLTLITSPNSDTKNVVLALDSSGNLTIGADASPTFQATGGKFTLLGETLFLSTTPGTNTNVEISPMDLGKIDLQKPIFNSTKNNNMENAIGAVEINDSLAVLATSSATSAFTINQTSTGQLISAYTGSVAKFAVDNNGNIISQQGVKWQPFSNSTSALNIANATGNAYVSFDTTNSRVGIGTLAPTYSLHINGSNAEIGLSASASDNVFVRWLQTTTERGAVFFLNSDSTFHVRSGSALALDTDNSNTPKVYITTSGNVGIGTVSPLLKLDVQDSQAGSAAAQIFNTDTGSDADGLIIKLGTLTAVDKANHFISFETSGIGVVGSVRGDGGTGVEFKTEGIADFAEYLKKDKDQTIEYGSVVCIDDKGLALPCDNTYQKIIGVSSNQGGFTGGKDQGEETVRVGFVGQVFTKVSTINGNIKPGDPLTSSSIPGVAVKAVTKGQIVGKALEGLFSCHAGGSETTDSPRWSFGEAGSISSGDSIPYRPSGSSVQNDSFCVGKILVVLSVSWYDPSIYISATGDLLGEETETPKVSTIVSPIPEIDEVHTNIISPLSSAAPTDLSTPQNDIALGIQIASVSAVPPTESLENASFSGTLDTNVSSTSAIIHDSKFMIPNSNLEGLMAFGPTSLSDTSITGLLSIGAIILQDNSINTIGTVLELQPLRQGALSIMGGLVFIDTNGDLKVDGNAQFSKDITVGGDIIASGSGTFSKLNLKLAKNALAVSAKEIIATGSAGTAFIRAYEKEVTIINNLITDKSLIYITPAGTPSGQLPFLLRQVPDGTWLRQVPEGPALPARQSLGEGGSETEGSFTVGIASPSAKNTPFNWLIIN